MPAVCLEVTTWTGLLDDDLSDYIVEHQVTIRLEPPGEDIITKIKIHTTNPNIIYAATMGVPFIKDNNRGIYKSIDGRVTWQQSLFISDSAGVIDMLMDPQNPDILYAAGWNRLRSNKGSLVAGPDARIYKTTDGGANWTICSPMDCQ